MSKTVKVTTTRIHDQAIREIADATGSSIHDFRLFIEREKSEEKRIFHVVKRSGHQIFYEVLSKGCANVILTYHADIQESWHSSKRVRKFVKMVLCQKNGKWFRKSRTESTEIYEKGK